MKEFLNQTKLLITRNLIDCKKSLHTINGYFLLTVLDTHVHPIHALKLFASVDDKIETLKNTLTEALSNCFKNRAEFNAKLISSFVIVPLKSKGISIGKYTFLFL